MKYIKKYEDSVEPDYKAAATSTENAKFQKGDWVRFNNLTRKNPKDVYEVSHSYYDMNAEQHRYWVFNIETDVENMGWVLEGALDKIPDEERDAIKYNL